MFADLRELVGARVIECKDPEAITKIRNLEDDGAHVERQRAAPIGNILVRAGNRAFRGIDVVPQHRQPVDGRER